MKKVLRFLGILLLIIVVAVVVMGLIAPKDVKIEKSIVINGSKDVVASQMFMFNNFNNWNPWIEYDTATKWHVEGTDGATGSKYIWESEKIGSGEMTATGVTADQKNYDMLLKGFMGGPANGYYRLDDAGNGQTKATWTFNQHSGFPKNAMNLVMVGMLEESFEKGLKNLKEYVESGKAGTGGTAYKIEEVEFPAHTYATIRKTIGFAEMEKFFGEGYGALFPAAGERISGPATGLYYKWDQQTGQTDVAAAVPVSGADPVKGAAMVNVPAGKSYLIKYTGGYNGSMKAHEAMGKHLAANGKAQGLVVEEYVVSQDQEPDSNKWVTNIYYLLQ
jgi:hypothetical protein